MCWKLHICILAALSLCLAGLCLLLCGCTAAPEPGAPAASPSPAAIHSRCPAFAPESESASPGSRYDLLGRIACWYAADGIQRTEENISPAEYAPMLKAALPCPIEESYFRDMQISRFANGDLVGVIWHRGPVAGGDFAIREEFAAYLAEKAKKSEAEGKRTHAAQSAHPRYAAVLRSLPICPICVAPAPCSAQRLRTLGSSTSRAMGSMDFCAGRWSHIGHMATEHGAESPVPI